MSLSLEAMTVDFSPAQVDGINRERDRLTRKLDAPEAARPAFTPRRSAQRRACRVSAALRTCSLSR